MRTPLTSCILTAVLAAVCLTACDEAPPAKRAAGPPRTDTALAPAPAPERTVAAPPVTPAPADTPGPAPAGPAAEPADGPLPRRWVFSFGYRRSREGVDNVKRLVDVAAEHGLNGMVLSSFGLDSITRWRDEDVELLKEVAAYCREKDIELIPTGFSVGYGGGALGHDRSFAAALPAAIGLEARGGKAVPVDGENLLKNGDLEEHENGRFKDFGFHDLPGKVTFADTEVVSSGKTSIRFEMSAANEHGHGRIMQKVKVRPGTSYRLTFRIRTEGLQPVSGVQALALKEKGTAASLRPKIKPTQDWTEVSLEFINAAEKELRVYAGVWGGKSGKFWIDDMNFREYGTLADVVRREGTPLELSSRDREAKFVEGRDFEPIKNLRDLKQVTLTPGTAIKDGEKLLLSCYKAPFVGHAWGKQISLCMSNPALYKYWEAQARRLHEVLGYKKVLLSMDEIRNGGGCLSCRRRGISMAEILGDCITKQRAIFRKIDPGIEVMIWSDMLDANHNARDNYYGVVGDFTGSWKHVPKDLTIMCWWHKKRDESLKFFSGLGFRTFGACYYDADDLQNPKEWLESLRKTPKATGIMYTSWRRKYDLLEAFGDLVSKK